MRNPEIWLGLIILGFLLFGAKRMPDAARGLGRSLRIFKGEMKGLSEDDQQAQHGQPAGYPQAAVQGQLPAGYPQQPVYQQPPAGYQQQPGYQQPPAGYQQPPAGYPQPVYQPQAAPVPTVPGVPAAPVAEGQPERPEAQ